MHCLLLLTLFAGLTFASTCRIMLMRFDEVGNLWVALRHEIFGSLEVPVVNGPCNVDATSLSPELFELLVHPSVQLLGHDESVLVFDSKIMEVSKSNLGSDDLSWPDPNGHVVWIAPKSKNLGSLLITEDTRKLLASIQDFNKEHLQTLSPDLKANFFPRNSVMTVKGLPNFGSTCYFNSTIQVLFRVPIFREFIKEAPQTFPYLPKDSITRQLGRLFRLMEQPNDIRVVVKEKMFFLFLLDHLLSNLGLHSSVDNPFEQSDPEEVITALFNAVTAETDISPWIRTSTINQLGQIKLVEEDHCSCGGRNVRTPILRYSFKLEDMGMDEPNELTRLIRESLTPRILLDVLQHEDHQNQRHLKIESLPPILIFHVNRRSLNGDKHDFQILFPLKGLDMTPYVSGYSGEPLIYDFIAASMHSGNLEAGHYTAGVMLPDCWYEISDDDHGKRYALPDRYTSIGKNAVLLVYQLRSTISESSYKKFVHVKSFHSTKESMSDIYSRAIKLYESERKKKFCSNKTGPHKI